MRGAFPVYESLFSSLSVRQSIVDNNLRGKMSPFFSSVRVSIRDERKKKTLWIWWEKLIRFFLVPTVVVVQWLKRCMGSILLSDYTVFACLCISFSFWGSVWSHNFDERIGRGGGNIKITIAPFLHCLNSSIPRLINDDDSVRPVCNQSEYSATLS